jgi:hypothetical protein
MLDEHEYHEASGLYRECMSATKEFRRRWNLPLDGLSIHDRFAPVRKWYADLTDVSECHHNAIMHHRLSLLGGPCRVCGKPLRSPRAKLCAACGAPAKD